MRLFPRTIVAACAAIAGLGLGTNPTARGAADPSSEVPTVMTVRGKLLVHDAFDRPLSNDWKTAKGKWEAVDGAIRGEELSADKHGAVTRHALPVRNAVIQYSFKLDGAKSTTLSINDAKGHVCRVVVTPQALAARKDDHDHDGPDKAAVLQTRKIAIAGGRWHTLLVEMQGAEMLARLDGETVVFGGNPGIDVDKSNFGLTVAGASVSFKDLRVWDAQPNPAWAANRAKLAQK
jgi:hypothetical protein